MTRETNRSPYALTDGDRVWLTITTAMNDRGEMATVVAKDTPAHCTGVWSVTVRFDGKRHLTRYPYPGCPLRRFAGGPDLWPAVHHLPHL